MLTDKKSHKNVSYLLSLDKNEVKHQLEFRNVEINDYKE